KMEKSDRDVTQALRAEDECRSLIVQFPNSKFAPEASQRLREIQEVLADHEFEVGDFYYRREINPAAANRLNALVDQWPLYSKADDALYEAGDAYSKMGPRFRRKSADMFARIAREYPLSDRANEAKKRLKDMEQPIPEPDPAAVARMKYEEENYRSRGMMARTTGWVRSSPDVTHAAKEGAPTMTDPKRTIPASIPVPVDAEAATASGGGGTATTEVTAQTAGASSALDTRPDARTPTSSASAQQASEAPPINRPPKEVERLKKLQAKKQAQLEKKAKKKNKNSDQNQNQQGGSATASASGVSNSAAQQSTATPANQ
ncbi:MAG: outer membrane protein assembly factor BamD, partial [Acidobacteriaceae bacterium]|nr:outer membrane protein assembly factor BamD [Acidobacteriaceae bacterium]